jgi:hypothetical protein
MEQRYPPIWTIWWWIEFTKGDKVRFGQWGNCLECESLCLGNFLVPSSQVTATSRINPLSSCHAKSTYFDMATRPRDLIARNFFIIIIIIIIV